jgi:hypothetical protein
MQQISDMIKENPDKDLSIEELQSFFSAFIVFSKQINDLTAKMNGIP